MTEWQAAVERALKRYFHPSHRVESYDRDGYACKDCGKRMGDPEALRECPARVCPTCNHRYVPGRP